MTGPETTWEPDAIRGLLERVDAEHQDICDSVDMLPSDLRTPATDAARALTALLAALEAERAEAARMAGINRETLANVQRVREHEHQRAERALAALADLRVAEVAGPYLIDDYDGKETIFQPDDLFWVDPAAAAAPGR